MNIAIISGASSGIGKSFAILLDACHLDQIWLLGRNKERLLTLQRELKTKSICLPIDLQEQDAFDTLKNMLTPSINIEYLVCSAGVGYNGKFDELTLKEISATTDTNCRALTLLNKWCLPYMTKGSKIIIGKSKPCQPSFIVSFNLGHSSALIGLTL